MVGITETKDLFRAGVAIKTAIASAKANDGKIDLLTDWPNFAQVLPALFAAVQGGDQIPAELKDLDEAEIAELRAEFGMIVEDPVYGKLFAGLATAASATAEIIARGKDTEDAPEETEGEA